MFKWIRKKDLQASIVANDKRIGAEFSILRLQLGSYNFLFDKSAHEIKQLQREIEALERKNDALQSDLKQTRQDCYDAVKYLAYSIKNPSKFKKYDKVKTFVVWDVKYTYIETPLGGSGNWEHGYQLKCTITDKTTEKYFSEKEITKIIQSK